MNRRAGLAVVVLAAGAGLVWWSQRRPAVGDWNRLGPAPGAVGQDDPILTIPIYY